MPSETLISVDIETAGPVPSRFALLAIGACLVTDPGQGFYVELQPDRSETVPEAMAVHGLSHAALSEGGQPPRQAMQAFADWVAGVTADGSLPVFVAFNAAFDWMFVADYFERYLGRNPFGYSALDIKAYYMGKMGVAWRQTSLADITRHFQDIKHLTHHALHDARDQAAIFRRILAAQPGYPGSWRA